MVEHRIRDGDFLRLLSTSTIAVPIIARVTIRYDDGTWRMMMLTDSTVADRSVQTTDRGPIDKDGTVVRAIVTGLLLEKRGTIFIELAVINQNEETLDSLAQDYLYNNHTVQMDSNVGPGPEGGAGLILKNALADDVTPVDIEHTLGITNALRRIDGFIWYYHASSDVANRTLQASFRDPGPGLPTGMTSGANTRFQIWPSSGVLTLTQDQQGAMYVNGVEGKAGTAVTIDNGARTNESTATQPIPFPYWASEDDVGEFFFDVVDAEAADRHSIYIIEEQWINV